MRRSNRKLKESRGWSCIEVRDIQYVIDQLQDLIDEMESNNIDSISGDSNTYRMTRFVSFGSEGYIDLDNLYDYISEQVEDEEDELDESLIKERYNGNPYSNTRQADAFDDACDCIHKGYGKMYWKKNFRNKLDVTQLDDIWDSAYNYMNESCKSRKR